MPITGKNLPLFCFHTSGRMCCYIRSSTLMERPRYRRYSYSIMLYCLFALPVLKHFRLLWCGMMLAAIPMPVSSYQIQAMSWNISSLGEIHCWIDFFHLMSQHPPYSLRMMTFASTTLHWYARKSFLSLFTALIPAGICFLHLAALSLADCWFSCPKARVVNPRSDVLSLHKYSWRSYLA